ncbi:hypothetical protein IC620_15585 [Hazenella sp. IB182357]|uniref:Helix-turn-helix domain containing protein n=1 Tax=Polycladospora coralii TaxID=2771432 RepID=A0A926NCL3_9BACL|nr:hypothetical protein [Polycladospora coralii]MBD1373767.1 hypothetical protein [Polycladospora coralii]
MNVVHRAKKIGRPATVTFERLDYIACQEWEFGWKHEEIADLYHMWHEGFAVKDIAKALNRHVGEVTCLIMDQVELNELEDRKGGLFGRRRPLERGGVSDDRHNAV